MADHTLTPVHGFNVFAMFTSLAMQVFHVVYRQAPSPFSSSFPVPFLPFSTDNPAFTFPTHSPHRHSLDAEVQELDVRLCSFFTLQLAANILRVAFQIRICVESFQVSKILRTVNLLVVYGLSIFGSNLLFHR